MPDDKDRVPIDLETDPDDLTVCLTCDGSGVLWGDRGFCACARGRRRRRAESEALR